MTYKQQLIDKYKLAIKEIEEQIENESNCSSAMFAYTKINIYKKVILDLSASSN